MGNFNDDCNGCKISQGQSEAVNKRGGAIDLGNKWLLNHYGGQEGFLGWMILQPHFHRMDLASLTTDEASAMGKNIRRIDNALRQYWLNYFPNDPIQRVYIVYFHESVFGNQETGHPSEEWHLHIHLIPRTRQLGQLLRQYSNNGYIRAWSIPEITKQSEGDFPEEYIKNDMKMATLVSALRDYLKNRKISET